MIDRARPLNLLLWGPVLLGSSLYSTGAIDDSVVCRQTRDPSATTSSISPPNERAKVGVPALKCRVTILSSLFSLSFPRSIPCESSTSCLFGISAPSSTNRATASLIVQKRHMAGGRYWRRLATNQRQAQNQLVPPRVQIAGASISFACLAFVINGSSIDLPPMERSAMAHERLEACWRSKLRCECR